MSNKMDKSRIRALLQDPTSAVFLAIVVLVILWFASGMIRASLHSPPQAAEPGLPRVAASWSEAQAITREIVLYGDVEPNQIAMVRARVEGIVEEVVDIGTRVVPGNILARLSSDDREARLAGVRAQLRSAELDYQATQKLAQRGVATASELESLLAQLEAARAGVRSVEVEIANTRLRAPIEGDVNRVLADIGAYVAVGGEVLEVVDNNPLVAVVYLHQADVARVRPGMPARVRFMSEIERDGVVSFVSPVADARTRTFRVEIAIENSALDLPSGLSAEVFIPTETVSAHRVSTALARLDTQGRLGMHIVDDDDRIEFVQVSVVQARSDAVWVSGLPERARLVTISRGALTPGQQVEVHQTPAEYLDTLGLQPASVSQPEQHE